LVRDSKKKTASPARKAVKTPRPRRELDENTGNGGASEGAPSPGAASQSSALDPRGRGWEPHPSSGFLELVGPIWQRMEGDSLVLAFTAGEKHKNRRGVVQGGMIATLLDRMMGLNVANRNGHRPQATLQLDVHFLDAVKMGEFVEARCTIERQTRSVTFATGKAVVASRPVAAASGVWKMLGIG
jgi:uncharacterized protein (TIGR00369 family)